MFEYKILKTKDSILGREKADRRLNDLMNEGWSVESVSTEKGDFGVIRCIVLGLIFLPLVLLGRKPGTVKYVLKRPLAPTVKPAEGMLRSPEIETNL